MLSWRFRLVLALVFSGTLIPSAFVSAQGFLQCTGALDCTLCAGVTVMQLIINGAIIIAFPVAAVLFTYAGGLMMTSVANPSGIQKAKDIFKSAGIGFVFVLCGWIIVDTIIHVVVINQNSSYFQNSSWNTVGTCSANRPMSAQVSQLLNGLFAPGNPNASPVAVVTGNGSGSGSGSGGISCPSGSVQAGTGGCAVNQFVLPTGLSCGSGSYNGSTADCVDSSGNHSAPSGTFAGCPAGTTQAGDGGCAQNQFVQPNGYNCSSGTFDPNSGGCLQSNGSITSMTPPTGGGGAWNGTVPASTPQTCGGASCSATASSDGQTVTYTNADGTQTTLQGGTLPWRDNNPGDISCGSFSSQNGSIGCNGRWAVFPDYATGAAAEVSLLQTSNYQSLTVAGAVSRMAPSFENPTAQIISNVSQAMGVSSNTSMSSVTQSQLQAFAGTIFKGEGYKAGTTSH